jgi:hypothetical protein
MGAVHVARAAAAIASITLAVGIVMCAAAPAQAVDVFVEVSPNTIDAGFQISIRAGCGETVESAVVTSEAFDRVTLVPDGAVLSADVVIPSDTRPRDYTVRLRCPNGKTASTKLEVLSMDRPTLGPNTGGGGTARHGAAGDGLGGAVMIIGGLATIGIGVGLGIVARRRRRAGQLA